MSKSPIEWTEETWNPIVGCSIVSPGCTNCYAMKTAARNEAMGISRYDGTTRKVNGNVVWTGKLAQAPEATLLAPLKRKKPTTYFVNSMGDLFHEDVPDEWIDRVFAVMALAPQHTFQVLTKRAARMQGYCSTIQKHGRWLLMEDIAQSLGYEPRGRHNDGFDWLANKQFLPNVWLGVSTERQPEADERIPLLLNTPAAVRFISAEPLLGPIDLTAILGAFRGGQPDRPTVRERIDALRGSDRREHLRTDGTWNHRRIDDPDGDPAWSGNCFPHLDWVIVGGESGPNARPMHPDWARSLRDQCAAAGVAFFFKQWGQWKPLDQFQELVIQSAGIHAVVQSDGRFTVETDFADPPRAVFTFKMRKKSAGRLLDGIEHNAMPVRP